MQRYLIYRVGQSILALIGVSILVFFLTRLSGNVLDIYPTPADLERVEKAWGLDKPMVVQYGIYVKNVLRGDWGESWKWGSGALEIVLENSPPPYNWQPLLWRSAPSLGYPSVRLWLPRRTRPSTGEAR